MCRSRCRAFRGFLTGVGGEGRAGKATRQDSERDGSHSYTVVVEKASSGDSRYAGVDGDDVQLVNRDDEPGFAFDQTRPGTGRSR